MGRLTEVQDIHPSEKPAKTQKHVYEYDANGFDTMNCVAINSIAGRSGREVQPLRHRLWLAFAGTSGGGPTAALPSPSAWQSQG